jgi:hypothetical protein
MVNELGGENLNVTAADDAESLIRSQVEQGMLTKDQVKVLGEFSHPSVVSYLKMNAERHEMINLLADKGAILLSERGDFESLDPFDAMKELLTIKRDFDHDHYLADNKRQRGIDDSVA